MINPLAACLIALALIVAGIAAYTFPSRRTKNQAPKARSSKKHGHRVDSKGEAVIDFTLTHRFFDELLKKHSSDEEPSHLLQHKFAESWPSLLQDPALFPRQPLVLPKLLQALRAETNGSQEFMNIILEDPSLTADVLKLANSPVYRNTKRELKNLEYALVMLGVEGLHSLVCSSVMKPIFAKRRADGFNSGKFWDWSLSCAQAAHQIGKSNNVEDPSTAYMLTLMSRLSDLVILRCCIRLAQEHQLTCQAKNIIPVIEQYRYQITQQLIREWGFDTSLINLLAEAASSSTSQNALIQAQTLAPELGSASFLVAQQQIAPSEAHTHLEHIGLAPALLDNFIASKAA